MIVVVMGVSGCGKSSVGLAIAAQTGWTFIEGDDLHPAINREKMASGVPLEDADRWPWLDAIANAASAIEVDGRSVVVACSALKRIYRERLRRGSSGVRFIHLKGERGLIDQRMRARSDHFMPAGLLDSQFATLEPPEHDEDALTFDIVVSVEEIAKLAGAALDSNASNSND